MVNIYMAVRTLESERRPYHRYTIKVSKFKDQKLKLDFEDSYFDKSDYMFVDNATGELYSYNDVAFNFCSRIADEVGFHYYEIKDGDEMWYYLDGPHGKLVDYKKFNSGGKVVESTDLTTGTINSLGRKANALNRYDKEVRDDFLRDIADDISNLLTAIEEKNTIDAPKLVDSLISDAKSLKAFATNIETVAEGLLVQLEKVSKSYK